MITIFGILLIMSLGIIINADYNKVMMPYFKLFMGIIIIVLVAASVLAYELYEDKKKEVDFYKVRFPSLIKEE